MINLLIISILCFTIIIFYYLKYIYHMHKYEEHSTVKVMDGDSTLPMYRKYIQRCSVCGKLRYDKI